jgi:hypothetical protein
MVTVIKNSSMAVRSPLSQVGANTMAKNIPFLSAAIAGALLSLCGSAVLAADMTPLPSKKGPEVESLKDYYFVPMITKIEAFGGALTEGYPYGSWVGQGGAQASVNMLIDDSTAIQVDGLLGFEKNSFVAGLSGHGYKFQLNKWLAGVYASGEYRGGSGGSGDLKFGGEGAYFINSFTLQGIAGAETQAFAPSRPGYDCQTSGFNGCQIGYEPGAGWNLYDAFDNLQPNLGQGLYHTTRFFDHVELAYYLTDDLKFSAAHEYTSGFNSAVLGVEYLYRTGKSIAPAVFVEGSIGEKGQASILGGVRIFFGEEDKPLIRREREDDPTTKLRRTFMTSANLRSRRDGQTGSQAGKVLNFPISHQCTSFGC